MKTQITTANELGRKALQGIKLVDVYPCEGGLKLRGRRIAEKNVMLKIQFLLKQAIKDLMEMQGIEQAEKVEKEYTINEMVDIFLNPHSGYIGTPCTDRDRKATIIAYLQDALALVRYIVGEEMFDSYYNIK